MEALGAPLDKIGPYWRKKMKAAIVGSSGYIASFLLERFAKEPSIESVLKIDQTEDADVHLDLANAELFDDSALEAIESWRLPPRYPGRISARRILIFAGRSMLKARATLYKRHSRAVAGYSFFQLAEKQVGDI